jgi:hypothetical protein
MRPTKFWTGSRWVVVQLPGAAEVSGPETSVPTAGVHSWLPKVLMVGALGLAFWAITRAEPRSGFVRSVE